MKWNKIDPVFTDRVVERTSHQHRYHHHRSTGGTAATLKLSAGRMGERRMFIG